MASATNTAQQLDRLIRGIVRGVDTEALTQVEKHALEQIRVACNEVKLDVRDYEYAETRTEQLKWAKIGRHNLLALNKLLLSLGAIFGPADIAECGAYIDSLQASLE